MDGPTMLAILHERKASSEANTEQKEGGPMKIMIVGDTHGNTVWLRDRIRQAHKYRLDKIIQVGDFGLWDHYDDGFAFLDTTNEELRKAGLKLYWVDGNHENHDRLKWYEKNNPKTQAGHVYIRSHILYIPRGLIWEWDGKRFAGVGGAYSIDKAYRKVGTSWWAGEQLTDTQKNKIVYGGFRRDPVDYLFTHDCSASTPFQGRLKNDPESHAHRQKMDEVARSLRPSFWFHGHMHTKYEWMYPLDHSASHWAQVYGLECDGMFWSWGVLDTETDTFKWCQQFKDDHMLEEKNVQAVEAAKQLFRPAIQGNTP
jgi:predicted phosphodiesterase